MRPNNVPDGLSRQADSGDGYRGTRFPDHEGGYGSELVRLNFVGLRPSRVEDSRRRLVRMMPALTAIDLEPAANRRRRAVGNTVVLTTTSETIAMPAKGSSNRAPIRRRQLKVA